MVADSTRAVAKDTIDGSSLIRRNGASSTSQRSLLQVKEDGPRITLPAPDEKIKETTNDSKFYDMADWRNNDVSLLELETTFEYMLCIEIFYTAFFLSTLSTWHMTDFPFLLNLTTNQTKETTAAQSPESDGRNSPKT